MNENINLKLPLYYEYVKGNLMVNVTFPQLIQRACGIDVHSEVVVATINGDGLQRETRNFTLSRVL